MSFWGGFVEGFAKTGTELIKADVARTDKIVDDTVKIGVSKALEMQKEIKEDKKRIRDELGMLTTQGFSLAKAASIVKAGMTSQMIKLINNPKNRLGADQLWDGTTKFAQDNKLTIQDVANKLSYQEPLDFGNLKVGTPKGSLLGALGLAPEVDTSIQEGIMSRVGKLDTGVDRSDIAILPGSIPLEAKKQFDTDTNLNMEQEIVKLEKEKAQLGGKLPPEKESLLQTFKKYKKDTFESQIASGTSTIAARPIDQNYLKYLYEQATKVGDKKSEQKLRDEIIRIKKQFGVKKTNDVLDALGISQ